MFGRRRDPDDFAKEIEAHLETEEAELRASGWSGTDARREARRRFGSVTRSREEFRLARPTRWVGELWQDVRYGARLMRRSPAFTLTAVAVLSIGIGVNTALFSVVNSLFFRDLHVRAPEELFYLYNTVLDGQVVGAMEQERFEFFRDEARDLVLFTGHSPGITRQISIDDETEVLPGSLVEHTYFDVLGVPFQLGRGFRAQDDDPTNPDLSIVISDGLWTRGFDKSPDVVGKAVRVSAGVNAAVFRIIGVAAPGFAGLSSPLKPDQFWITAIQASAGDPLRSQRSFSGGPIGRLKPGVSLDQVRSLVAAKTPVIREQVWQELAQQTRDRYPNWIHSATFPIYPVADVDVPRDPTARLIPTDVLAAMITVVGLVLLIATTNIAGLLLARGVTRTGEVAVRQALGAGGSRLVRQILTETVLLSASGGVLGAGVAMTLVRLFSAWTPSTFAVNVTFDGHVLLFATAICVGVGALVGLAPALQATRVNVLQALGSGLVGSKRSVAGLRRWIVVPQVAASLVLLLVASVHLRALTRLELSDLGYRTEGAVVLTVGRWGPPVKPFPRATAEELEANAAASRVFSRAMLSRIRNVPGITGFALATSLPLQSATGDLSSVIDQRAYLAGESPQALAARVAVSDGYFDVMGMRLLRGRTFDDRDALYGTRVALVSSALANKLAPSGDTIGRSISFVSANSTQQPEWLQVIGVVNEVDPVLNDVGDRPDVYVSLMQEWRADAGFLVARSAGDQASLIRGLKDAVIGADTFADVSRVRTMRQIVAEILYPRRVAAGVLSAAGLVGLVLACIGLYGIVSYAAAQRQRELGIRATLGAAKADLIGLVLKEGVAVMVVGTLAGLGLAALALRLTARVVPNLPSIDPVLFVLVPLGLLVIVLTACLVPASRAARIDPARVLRGE